MTSERRNNFVSFIFGNFAQSERKEVNKIMYYSNDQSNYLQTRMELIFEIYRSKLDGGKHVIVIGEELNLQKKENHIF